MILIIYNKYLLNTFNLPILTYETVFFLTMFLSLLFDSTTKTINNVIKSVNKKENKEYSKDYLIASFSLLFTHWLFILLLKFFNIKSFFFLAF